MQDWRPVVGSHLACHGCWVMELRSLGMAGLQGPGKECLERRLRQVGSDYQELRYLVGRLDFS